MSSGWATSRRRFFAVATAGVVAAGCARDAKSPSNDDEDVTPSEDLMREHGALNRILLVYEESVRRIEAQEALSIAVVAESAEIVRRFIEQYHEKLEEDFLFPRFEKANRLVELVTTLRRQHQAGRTVTETVLRLATPAMVAKEDERRALVAALRSFVRMYRPHEAREDTVLFPALPTVIGKKELAELGERFEDKEHELFGKDGFEGVVVRIGKLEEAIGIHDLNRFTPTS